MDYWRLYRQAAALEARYMPPVETASNVSAEAALSLLLAPFVRQDLFSSDAGAINAAPEVYCVVGLCKLDQCEQNHRYDSTLFCLRAVSAGKTKVVRDLPA